jgi:competence protein ComGC
MIFSKKSIAAFTLIELMVALTIYILIALLLLANQDKFNDSISLTDLAYDVALSIRQAQTYSYAVTSNSGNASSEFQNYFGVHLTSANTTSFIIFSAPIVGSDYIAGFGAINTNAPAPYISSAHPVTVSIYNLQNGYRIGAFCENPGANQQCWYAGGGSGSGSASSTLDIEFQRPNTNAIIYFNASVATTPVPNAAIELQSPTGDADWIEVYQSGDIEVLGPTEPTS